MNILFYLQSSTELFDDQDDIHFWRLESSITTMCSSLKRHWSSQFLTDSILLKPDHKVSLIIPQCWSFPSMNEDGDVDHQTMLLMQRTRVEAQEESLKREKQTKYKDSARIRLEHFNFSKSELDVHDRFNVTNLVSIFEGKGCFQQNSRHYVTVVIDRKQLNLVTHSSKISSAVLLNSAQIERSELQLSSKFRLECFHDRCRVQAERKMTSSQLWWIVNLYLTDMIDWFLTEQNISHSHFQIWATIWESTWSSKYSTRRNLSTMKYIVRFVSIVSTRLQRLDDEHVWRRTSNRSWEDCFEEKITQRLSMLCCFSQICDRTKCDSTWRRSWSVRNVMR